MANIATRDDNRVPSLLGVDHVAFHDPTTAAVNTVTHAILVEPQGIIPTSGLNASYILSYNVSDELVKIQKTIGATTYTKTSVPKSGVTVVSYTVSYSSWS